MNVPDDRRFPQTADFSNPQAAQNGFKMVYHGTITERLGIDLAISSVARLLDRIPGLELHLWGGGDYLDACLQLAEQLGLEDRVQFHGRSPVDKLTQKLRGMQLGVVANRKSPATELMLPVKMLEYIALGIPVIAPRLKGVQYYFSDKMVSYFEPEDVDSMEEAILRLYNNPALRVSQSAHAHEFLNRYGWDKQRQDFLRLYEDL